MKKISLVLSILISFKFSLLAQSKKDFYEAAFQEQVQMLKGQKPLDFKRAVFVTENAYNTNKLSYQSFCADIAKIGGQLRAMIDQRGISKYKTAGNWAAFTYMTDTIAANGLASGYKSLYGYDHLF